MDQIFSTNANISLEKQVDKSVTSKKTAPEDIEEVYEIKKCLNWIEANGYKKVCLQFPDSLLLDSTDVAFSLQSELRFPVYVMGDTAYESCCVDYVAAAHVDADAIIHFGPVCFSHAENKIPCLYIYEKAVTNVESLYNLLKNFRNAQDDNKRITIVIDTHYIHMIDILRSLVQNTLDIDIIRADEIILKEDFDICIFIGQNNRKLMNIACLCSDKSIYYLDPQNADFTITPYNLNTTVLKRRYFLIEKIKDSKTIGIVIGTLAVKNYLQIIERIKQLCKLHGKKYYIISVGKPTVAKLANFPEIDIYAIISCMNSEIYENRDFYKPIVTPYDIEIALNPRAQHNQFSYDYNLYLRDNLDDLTQSDLLENDVSLLTGNVRCTNTDNMEEMQQESGTAVALRNEGTIAVGSKFGAGYLSERTWKGLEQNLGENEVEQVTDGRKGIAQFYENEML